MTDRQKYYIVGAAILTAFAFGRFSAPEKVKIQTQYVETENKIDSAKSDTDQNKHKETTTTEVVKPDGSKETTTKVVEDTNLTRSTAKLDTSDSTVSKSETKEITRGGSKVTIAALASLRINDLTAGPNYGLWVSKPLLGPITVGVWGMKDGTVGGALGLTF